MCQLLFNKERNQNGCVGASDLVVSSNVNKSTNAVNNEVKMWSNVKILINFP